MKKVQTWEEKPKIGPFTHGGTGTKRLLPFFCLAGTGTSKSGIGTIVFFFSIFFCFFIFILE